MINYPFKFRGPYDNDNHEWLYWSNEDGWVNFKSATVFEYGKTDSVPMEATHVAWLNPQGRVEATSELFLVDPTGHS